MSVLHLSLAALAFAIPLAIAYLCRDKPKQDQQDHNHGQDGENDPPYNLRPRPLVPAVDLSTYTYM